MYFSFSERNYNKWKWPSSGINKARVTLWIKGCQLFRTYMHDSTNQKLDGFVTTTFNKQLKRIVYILNDIIVFLHQWWYDILRPGDIWGSCKIPRQYLERFSTCCWYILYINTCLRYKLITARYVWILQLLYITVGHFTNKWGNSLLS